jgi:hypothetical protein
MKMMNELNEEEKSSRSSGLFRVWFDRGGPTNFDYVQ